MDRTDLESELRLVAVSKLNEHEQTRDRHFERLLGSIEKSRKVRPIIVDRKSMVILDGHHRFRIMKALGLRKIPAHLVDYMSPRVEVFPRRKDIPVSKDIVVAKGLNGERFPPKTSRHVITGLANDFMVPIDLLR
jgi:hypothetical protein